jgi:hypothetical protein
MQNITVEDGQSLFDLSVSKAGSIAALFDIAEANGLSPTDALSVGSAIIIPEVIDAEIVGYYEAAGINPATADMLPFDSFGIGEMNISSPEPVFTIQ